MEEIYAAIYGKAFSSFYQELHPPMDLYCCFSMEKYHLVLRIHINKTKYLAYSIITITSYKISLIIV